MQEADLLEPHRPLTPFIMTNTESESRILKGSHHDTSDEDYCTDCVATDGVGDAAHHRASREDTDDAPEKLQSIRQRA